MNGNCGNEIKIATIDIPAIAGTFAGIKIFNKIPIIQQAKKMSVASSPSIGSIPCPIQLLKSNTTHITASKIKDCTVDRLADSFITAPKHVSVVAASALLLFLNLLTILYRDSVRFSAINKLMNNPVA